MSKSKDAQIRSLKRQLKRAREDLQIAAAICKELQDENFALEQGMTSLRAHLSFKSEIGFKDTWLGRPH